MPVDGPPAPPPPPYAQGSTVAPDVVTNMPEFVPLLP